MNLFLVFMYWHVFFLTLKVLYSACSWLEGRFVGKLHTRIGVYAFFFLLVCYGIPGFLFVAVPFLVEASKAAAAPYGMEKEYVTSAVLLLNGAIFFMLGKLAKRCNRPGLRFLYDMSYPSHKFHGRKVPGRGSFPP